MRATEVLVRRRTSPMKISFVRPKPLARRLSVKRRANKTRIRPVLSLGSRGSPLALADGIAITNHQAQRPCEPVGTNSKPWQPVMLLQALDKIRESRSSWTMGWQPSYQAEGHIYAQYLLKVRPEGKIGILYQNDDYGKDYVKGLKDGLNGKMQIVAEV